MTALGEDAPSSVPAVEPDRCARCAAELVPDQEWCLECGSARTVILRPPDPRIGVALAGGVALAALIALAIVLLNLSTAANRELPAGSARSTSTSSGAVAGAHPAARIADWPVGLSGWTVVLGRARDQATATAVARRLGAGGLSTGVLNSSEHPRLQAGYFVVFSGRYPTKPAAQAAAASLRARGQPQALARQVARPGGL